MTTLSRRTFAAAAMAAVAAPALVKAQPPKSKFTVCLNTSTIRDANGKPRPIRESIRIAKEAGYQAIEPWILEIDEFRKKDSLADLKKLIEDAGLIVPDAIGFAEWIVDDAGRRAKGLDQAKRDMDLVKQIGGTRLAAPPVGATGGTSPRDDPKASQAGLDLMAAADRYRALLEIGQSMGVTPIVEIWGFSKNVSRLGQAVLIATECGKAGGGVLPDVYHLYKGGSDFAGLKLLAASAIGIFHVNDYPAIDRAKIVDADRVYPGDGVAPIADILKTLSSIGFSQCLSLELFNREYWKQDPMTVAKTGRAKLAAVIEKL